MIKLLNQNKMEFTEDIMNARDFIMEQLRVIDELFYNIIFIRFNNNMLVYK